MEIQGILHCHSNYSYDAKLSLAELRELFLANGLRFACMTEHADELTPERAAAFVKECDALSDGAFLFIPGFEVPFRRAHILMIGARKFLGNYAPTAEALQPWAENAGFIVLAHPVRNAFEVSNELLMYLDGVEVWNQQYDGKRVPRTRSIKLITSLRERKPSLVATGGVDFHRREHLGSPIVTLSVDALTEDALIEKLKLGTFTVSSPLSRFFGLLTNAAELRRTHRFESFLSVAVIVTGKRINALLAFFGLSFPASLTQLVRKRV